MRVCSECKKKMKLVKEREKMTKELLLEQQIKELELRIKKLEQDINLTIALLEKTK